MIARLLVCAFICLAFGDPAFAQIAEQPAVTTEEFVVTGQREGPRVWRVTKGDHELVIFGVLSPLPRGVTWRSNTIETLVSEADLVKSDAISITFPEIGALKAVGLALQLRGLRKNDGKAKLRDVLPPDLYARFDALRTQYRAADNAWEALRPLAAVSKLEDAAFDQIGVRSQSLTEEVRKIAVKAKRTWKATTVEFRGDVKAAIREADANADEAELACFRETLDSLETDLPLLRKRANAWAIGDVGALRALPLPSERKACLEVLRGSKDFSRLIDQARDKWLEEVDAALQTNRSTFLVVRIDTVLRGKLLQTLRDKGYAVEGP